MNQPLRALLLLCLLPAGLARADTLAPCKTEWQTQARAEQLSARIVDQLIPSLTHLPRVIELDRRQPEFTSSFGDYLARRVTEKRIERGRELLTEHADLLRRLTREYGVPGRYLVAFWGLETNYGGYLGDTATLDALATLACDERRSRYFTAELFNALTLIDRHGLDPAQMSGSWAGAMGHTQFMPSNYRRYGIDGDGDGKVDLFNSIPDALTSAAHFLAELGWEPELRWGREVRLPEGFPYELAGLAQPRPLAEWAELGVRRADGGTLPVADVEAALVVPAGHRGPAFMAYKNFRIIMRWNNSSFYAISVGHLADRLIGAGPLHQAPPEDGRLALDTIEKLQARLNELGFAAGKPDGVPGPDTRRAIREFQQDRGLVADGYHGPEVLEALGIAPDR